MKYWAVITLLLASPIQAVDDDGCPKDTICAADPASIVAVMQDEGYRAKLEKDKTGDPKISSQASGHQFEIYFYGCVENKNCKSIQFTAGFSPADDQTPEYANKWNNEKRFIKASITDKKELDLNWDLTTVGGMMKENFVDSLDWWAVMLGEFSAFVEEQEKTDKAK